MSQTVGDYILERIYDEVDRRLNPDDEECPACGGEGYIADCFDGFCVDAEFGCEDCTRRCVECRLYAGRRAKAVREAVIDTINVDVAIAWLKEIGRWRDDITRETVQRQLEDMAIATAWPSSAILGVDRDGN